MIKLNSLDRWSILPTGKAVAFKKGPERIVRLNLNCRDEIGWMIHLDGGEIRLLAVTPPGVSTVEFVIGGGFTVFPDNKKHGEIHYWTAETEPSCVEIPDAVSFTKIAERRARNPVLEAMMQEMRRHAEQRDAARQRAFDQQLAALAAATTKVTADVKLAGTTPPSATPPAPAPAPDAGAPS